MEATETTQHVYSYDNAQINKAVDALFDYLSIEKAKQQNVLWDDNEDINIVIEYKVKAKKSLVLNSIRIPLAHSFRKDDFHEICIITRTIDASKFENALLNKYPVFGVTKIIGLKEFKKDYKSENSRKALCNLYDLFIFHPSVQYEAVSKIVCFLRNQNKSYAILPQSDKILKLPKLDYGLSVDYKSKIAEKRKIKLEKQKKKQQKRKQKKSQRNKKDKIKQENENAGNGKNDDNDDDVDDDDDDVDDNNDGYNKNMDKTVDAFLDEDQEEEELDDENKDIDIDIDDENEDEENFGEGQNEDEDDDEDEDEDDDDDDDEDHKGEEHSNEDDDMKDNESIEQKKRIKEENAKRLSELIEKYRDSTFLMNVMSYHRFIKVGEINMPPSHIKDNITQVLKYVSSIVPCGGFNNILRISLHLNHTTIQLPFYYNLDRNPCYTMFQNHENTQTTKKEEIRLKRFFKNNVSKKSKQALLLSVPIKSLYKVPYYSQCNNKPKLNSNQSTENII